MSAPASSSSSSSSSSAPLDVHDFIRRTTSLVALERSAEVDEEAHNKSAKNTKVLEQAGVLLTRLVVSECTTGLYGRCLLTLEPARGGPLRQSELSGRDIVELSATTATGGSTKLATGVVYRMKETSITIVLDEFLDPADRVGQMSVLKLANQVTYDRYKYALDFLTREFTSSSRDLISSRLMRVLYSDVEPVFSTQPIPWIPYSQSLNEQQKVAVQQALDANDVYMIHGPPGTGKTTTVVELIRQFVARGLRVLACAPSNLAVDNLVEKLSEKVSIPASGRGGKAYDYDSNSALGIAASSSASYDAATSTTAASVPAYNLARGSEVKLCRLGHPARIIPSVLKYTLDYVVKSSDAANVCAGIREDMAKTTKQIDKSKDRSERNGLRRDLRELQRALRTHERKAIEESLKSTQVICCTLTNCASKLMDQFNGNRGVDGFDVIVIDEAAQALEVACLLPAMKGRKLILAGDNKQLGPTVKSKEATAGGLERTLFDRLYAMPYGKKITTMLVEQYRMNAVIMKWSSDELYQGRLIGPDSITKHTLADLPNIKATEDTTSPFVVIDTAGLNMYEDTNISDPSSSSSSKSASAYVSLQQQRSKSNANECALIKTHLDALIAAGLSPKDIAIIAPYNGQVSLLREMLLDEYVSKGLGIGTVDGFQGMEREAILITMVRSNDEQEVGFLKEDRRINVAITRARRHVCIVLDSNTVSSHPFLARLIEYASEHGDYRMAQDPNEVRQDHSVVANASPDGPRVSVDSLADELEPGAPVQHPIVSKPKVKQPKKPSSLQPKLVASSSSPPSAGLAAEQPGEVEEWPESRIENICTDLLRRARAAEKRGESTANINFFFPPTLNSYQRQLVHSVAERIDSAALSHVSVGDGLKRFIALRFVPTPVATASSSSSSAAAASSQLDDDDDDDVPFSAASTGASKNAKKKAAKKAANLLAAQTQQLSLSDPTESKEDARRRALDAMEMKSKGKISNMPPAASAVSSSAVAASAAPTPSIPSASGFAALADEEADDANIVDHEDGSSSSASATVKSNNNKKKKAKKKSAASDESKEDDATAEDDFDDIIADFNTDQCKQDGCSARVKVMGFVCQYCKEKWCVKHFNPALHGCGPAHKAATLKLAQQNANGVKHTLKDHERDALKAKLDKKIAADKKTRTTQPKADEKKKK